MKKLVYTIVFFFICTISSSAQFNIGLGTTVAFEGAEIGVQAKALINVDEKWRFSPAVNYYLTNGLEFGFDADVHYKLFTLSDNVNIFPVGGLNWSNYGEEAETSAEIGLNLGLISDFTVKDGSLHFYIEPKFLIQGSNTGFLTSAGILF